MQLYSPEDCLNNMKLKVINYWNIFIYSFGNKNIRILVKLYLIYWALSLNYIITHWQSYICISYIYIYFKAGIHLHTFSMVEMSKYSNLQRHIIRNSKLKLRCIAITRNLINVKSFKRNCFFLSYQKFLFSTFPVT